MKQTKYLTVNNKKMEYIDTIRLDNGQRIKRYWAYFSGKREIVEVPC